MQSTAPQRPALSLGVLVKVAVAGALFALLAGYVDVGGALRRIGKADLGLFLLATGLIMIQALFVAARWSVVARAIGFRLPFREAVAGTFEACFFNQALPSTLGGDAVRVWRASRWGMGFGPATVGVIVDRALGLLAVALLASFGALALWRTPGGETIGATLGLVAAAVVIGAIGGGLVSGFFPKLLDWRLGRPLYWLSDGVARVARSPRLAAQTLFYSLAGHLLTVLAFERLAASLGMPLGFEGAWKSLPASLLAAAIPLSISGWGIREGVGVVVLGLLGHNAEDALAVSLLLGISLLLIGLFGGLVWLLGDTVAVAPPPDPGHGAQGEARDAGPATFMADLTLTTANVPAAAVAASAVAASAVAASTGGAGGTLSDRKREILAHAEAAAATRDQWIAANPAYFEADRNYMRFLIPEGARVLDLGCATGDLLARLNPARGVGVDLSPAMIARARANHPGLEFVVGDAEDPALLDGIEGPFDAIILSDTIGLLDDLERALGLLHRLCGPETRLVIGYYCHLWEPLIYLAETLGLRPRQPKANYISRTDFENILHLADFEPIRTEWRQIVPKRLFGIGPLINRYIGTLPLIRRLCLRRYIVARSLRAIEPATLSASILIPCRNERGNIESAVKRMPRFGAHQEIVFIEGNSSDDTFAECLRVKEAYKAEWDIKVVKQEGRGKGDAMRKGYATATGDVLMILDADLSVPPEMMPRFYEAIASGKGEFINGSRLVYPMQDAAMRPLNFIANRIFAWLFTYLLNQRFTDTLCGTKVFRRRAYEKIQAGRSYFGEFDPFGDFDLIFGASKQSLRIVEIPVHYKARTYGETQISRFRDGLLLLRMVAFAWRKLKAI